MAREHALPSPGKRAISSKDAETERAVKRRASKACQHCRGRKVRCDAIATGSPCTNCKLDKLECILIASRRGQNRSRRSTSKATSTKTVEQDINTRSGHKETESLAASHSSDHDPVTPTDVPVSVTFDEDPNKVERDRERTLDTEEDERVFESMNGVSALATLRTPDVVENVFVDRNRGRFQLPAFVARLSNRISSEDIEFLARKGAMIVPDPALQKEILRGYLLGVHPFMPMLDFDAFRDIVTGSRKDLQLSLLLFQAVMFAGLHSLQLHVIQRLGFACAKKAREVFFNRVRLLYEFDVERDSAAVLQSLILMSSWYGKWDDRKHTWHYTGLAYDVARNLGLHREPSARFSSDKIRRFRRRLWWSLYIRDRLIALGTRRPMRIRDDEFDVQMLCLSDFEIEQEQDVSIEENLCLGTEDTTKIALMCVQLAELCKCIGHVVASQYTVLNGHVDVPYTMMVVSRRNADNSTELEQYDAELNRWNEALASKTLKPGLNTHDPQSCASVHWTILNITYLTVVNVLHRAQALQPGSESSDARHVQSLSKKKVKETARSLTKSMQTMLRHDQVRYLGPIGVTAIVASSLSHMLDVSSDDEDIRDASAFRLSQNLQVLSAIREAYASADAAISFLATVTRRAGLLVPSHTASNQSAIKGSWLHGRTDAALAERPTAGARSVNDLSSPNQQALLQGQDVQPPAQAQNGAACARKSHFADDNIASSGLPMIFDIDSGYTMKDSIIHTENWSTPGLLSGFGELSDSATHGAFYDWTINTDPSIDLDAMAFNHDFYSDTFQIM